MPRGRAMWTPMRDRKRHVLGVQCAVMAAAALVGSGWAAPPPAAPAPRTATEQRFPDPKAAVAALLAACRANDERALLAIFGADSAPLVSTGNPDADRERCRRLVAAAAQLTPLGPAGAGTLGVAGGE